MTETSTESTAPAPAESRHGRGAADLDAAVVEQEATAAAEEAQTGTVDPDEVIEALKDVVDPELGINIVDLGLVYDVVVDQANRAVIDMTLTSAACPLTDMIEDQISAALLGVGGESGLVDDARINWVWMPPWDISKITDDGRDQLRALGFNV